MPYGYAKKKKTMNVLDYIAFVLLVVGGLNWGPVGIANVNVVGILTGSLTWLARIIYTLVGVSAGYGVYTLIKLAMRG